MREKQKKNNRKNSFKHAKIFCPADDKSFLLRHSKSRKTYFSEKIRKILLIFLTQKAYYVYFKMNFSEKIPENLKNPEKFPKKLIFRKIQIFFGTERSTL